MVRVMELLDIMVGIKPTRRSSGKASGSTTKLRLRITISNFIRLNRRFLICFFLTFSFKGLKSYTMNMNQFGDLMHHEFVSMMNGYKKSSNKLKGMSYIEPAHVSIPESVDWRDEGELI